jgi:hypothetical protein
MPIFLMNEWNRIDRGQAIIVCGSHLYLNFRIHRLLLSTRKQGIFGLISSCSSIEGQRSASQGKDALLDTKF